MGKGWETKPVPVTIRRYGPGDAYSEVTLTKRRASNFWYGMPSFGDPSQDFLEMYYRRARPGAS